MGKGCSFGLLFVSFVKIYQVVCVLLPLLVFFFFFFFFFLGGGGGGGRGDLIILVPDHCISLYFLFCYGKENLILQLNNIRLNLQPNLS